MSNVIDLLAQLGSGTLAQLDEAALAPLDPQVRAALLSGDQARLVELLGGRSNMVCGLFPAKEKDKEEPNEDDTPAEAPQPGGLRNAA
jgi:hypothetical protein